MSESEYALRDKRRGVLRVALLYLPPLYEEILRDAVGKRDDLRIVDWSAAGDAKGPDVFVVGVGHEKANGVAHDLLQRMPDARVFQARNDGAQAALYELRPRRTFLGSLTPSEFAEALCAPPYSWAFWKSED